MDSKLTNAQLSLFSDDEFYVGGEAKHIKEYHDNGQLAYEETIVILPKNKEHLYPYKMKHDDGYCWIRVGIQAKYHDNGLLAWKILRNNQGKVIDSKNGYRKDGTPIQY